MTDSDPGADRTPHPTPASSVIVEQAQRPAWNPTADPDTTQPVTVAAAATWTPRPGWTQRLLAYLDLPSLPQVITQARPALADRIRYSRHGEWTTAETTSWRRRLHLAYTLLIAIPVGTACAVVDWSTERPGRLAFLSIAAVAIGTSLSFFPFLSWAVPSVFDLGTWF